MAKTIEQMAEKYGNMPYAIEYARDKQKGTKLLKQLAYRDGANAVLSEIEQAIKDCDVDGSPYAAVLDRIKQLKGESVW